MRFSKLFMLIVILMLNCGLFAQSLELKTVAANGSYGCRRQFGAGIYDKAADKTLICWNGPNMSVFVRQFDHKAKKWGEALEVCRNNYSTTWDYHNYPTMVQAPDGHFLIFFFKHSTTAFMLRSPGPHKIDGQWEKVEIESNKNAYPMPVVIGSDVYLFYSRSDDISVAYRTYQYIKSADSGRTWSKPVKAIDSEQKIPGRYDEVYAFGCHVVAASAGKPAKLQLGWEMHGGKKHNAGTRNNYFAFFTPSTGKFSSIDGTDLGECIEFDELEEKCLLDEGENPDGHCFGYSTLSTTLADGSAAAFYGYSGSTRMARFVDGRWQYTKLPMSNIGDVVTLSDGTLRVLCSVSPHGYVGYYESKDDGKSWKLTWKGKIPHANGSDITSSRVFIQNFHEDIQAVICCTSLKERMTDYSGKWPIVVIQAADIEK